MRRLYFFLGLATTLVGCDETLVATPVEVKVHASARPGAVGSPYVQAPTPVGRVSPLVPAPRVSGPAPAPSVGSLREPAGLPLDQTALAVVNGARALAGVPLVTLDPTMSAACAKHAHYLVLNKGKDAVKDLKAHTEDPSLPGATPEGANAAAHSDIAYDPPGKEVQALLSSLFHRTPVLAPRVIRVGYAREEDASGFSASLLMFAYDDAAPEREVQYPANGQVDVPLKFRGEVPDPLPPGAGPAGYPITLYFGAGKPSDVTYTLTDGAGADVPIYGSDPEHPADAPHQGNVACMFPREVLRPATTYRAHFAATVDGAPRSWDWSFKTEGDSTLDARDYAALEAAIDHPVVLRGDVKLVETKDGGNLVWLQTMDPNWVRIQLPAGAPFDRTRFVARRVEVRGVAQRESKDTVGVRPSRAEDLVVLPEAPPLVEALNVDAAVGKLVRVHGKVVRAGSTTDGGRFVIFKEPPAERTAFMTADVWAALGFDAAALKGKQLTIRCVPRLEAAGRITFNVEQADQVGLDGE